MFTDLTAWLSYIEQSNPDQMHLGLDHLRPIADLLAVVQFDRPVITVAGTNGKGSTIAALESFLLVAKQRVGSYTSPHLLHFNERIKINGQPVGDAQLCAAFSVVEQARKGQWLTYFEWATLAALWIFKQAELDVLLLEVGLGGRLDAVNLVENNISIITGIDYDHQDWLGSTLDEIAREKAGIFKIGQIALCGQRNAPAIIQQRAVELQLDFFDRQQFGYQKNESHWDWWGKNASGSDICYLALPHHTVPFSNLAVAIQALQFILPSISQSLIVQGLQRLSLLGRLQRLPIQKNVVVDVAHNPQSIAYLVKWLQQQSYQKLYLVMGVLADKDDAAMLQWLLPYVDVWFVAQLSSARALPVAQLQQRLIDVGAQSVQSYSSLIAAYQQAYATAGAEDLVLVCGSFYAVAPILTLCGADGK